MKGARARRSAAFTARASQRGLMTTAAPQSTPAADAGGEARPDAAAARASATPGQQAGQTVTAGVRLRRRRPQLLLLADRRRGAQRRHRPAHAVDERLRIEAERDQPGDHHAGRHELARAEVGELPAVRLTPLEGALHHPQRVDSGEHQPDGAHHRGPLAHLPHARQDQELGRRSCRVRAGPATRGRRPARSPPKRGATVQSPPICSMSRVWMRSSSAPTRTKRAPVERAWQTISSTTPCSASSFQANTPSSTKPIWLTLV